MPHCLISLIDEAEVPAEQQGVLTALNIREGANVQMGQQLAQIDDRQAQLALTVAEKQLAAAQEQATNEIDIEFYRRAAEVSQAEHQEMLEANRKVRGTHTDGEVRRALLNYKKALAQVDQAVWNRKVEGLTRDVKQAELDAAQLNIDLRSIDSPLDGIVYEVYKHRGEWVQPGEPILRIVRMDVLRVEGFLRAREFSPDEVQGREVTVVVRLSRGQELKLKSRITFVSPLVEPTSGEYRVSADVSNVLRDGFLLIRPGLNAEMTIHLREG
jgi:multidrug efflux pump subunit AcrA (membrane-fusion protein)